jgi:hypothetical protein
MYWFREFIAFALLLVLLGAPFILIASIIFVGRKYGISTARWAFDSVFVGTRTALPELVPIPVVSVAISSKRASA